MQADADKDSAKEWAKKAKAESAPYLHGVMPVQAITT